jgi:hypothetical protein
LRRRRRGWIGSPEIIKKCVQRGQRDSIELELRRSLWEPPLTDMLATRAPPARLIVDRFLSVRVPDPDPDATPKFLVRETAGAVLADVEDEVVVALSYAMHVAENSDAKEVHKGRRMHWSSIRMSSNSSRVKPALISVLARSLL